MAKVYIVLNGGQNVNWKIDSDDDFLSTFSCKYSSPIEEALNLPMSSPCKPTVSPVCVA